MSDDQLTEAHGLIMGVLEETLSPAQAKRLETLVRENKAVRQRYIMYVHQRCVIATMGRPMEIIPDLNAENPPVSRSLSDTMVVRAIQFEDFIDDEQEVLEAPPSIPRPQEPQTIGEKIWRIRKYLVAAMVALAVCAVAAIVLFNKNSKPEIAGNVVSPPGLKTSHPRATGTESPVFVANLTRQIAAHWEGNQPGVGAEFKADAHLLLNSGLAEITYSTGTTVIFEGPADITLEPNAVRFPNGKLAATVPPTGHGFAVHTRQSTVTDLGTELGVDARASSTEIDVFKGKVTAQPVSSAAPPVLLVASKAATVNGQKVMMQTQGAMVQKFVRQLQTDVTSLDVVDLVAGGAGTTHLRGAGMDVRSGKYGKLGPIGTVKGDQEYHLVNLPVIDGCFIPKGIMKIDSAGDQFDFGNTSNRSYGGIQAGLPIAWGPSTAGTDHFTANLGGIDYSQPGHGFLLVHASSGFTLNLDAIRRLYPDRQLTGFHALVGNTAPSARTRKPFKFPHTDSLILIDGKLRAERRNFTHQDGPGQINVSFSDADHFLTIVNIDRQTDTEYDWTILADPTISCGPAENR